MEFSESEIEIIQRAGKLKRHGSLYGGAMLFVLLCLSAATYLGYLQLNSALIVGVPFLFLGLNAGTLSGAPSYSDLYNILENKLNASPSQKIDPIIEVLTRTLKYIFLFSLLLICALLVFGAFTPIPTPLMHILAKPITCSGRRRSLKLVTR